MQPELSDAKRSTNVSGVREQCNSVLGRHENFVERASPRETVEIWGVPFDNLTLYGAVNRIAELIERQLPEFVITANLNYVMLHNADRKLRRATRDAAMILADGQPIVWRSRLGKNRLPERVAGSELIFRLAERASEEGWRIYMLGGKPGVADRASERLRRKYPGIQIVGVESPPFRALTASEQEAQMNRIRQAKPDLLLVAFGQPKGELWIHKNLPEICVPVSIQLGASFDFLAGTANRAPVFWQRIGMEWAYRMVMDPARLMPRYANNATFLMRSMALDLIQYVFPNNKRFSARQLALEDDY